MLHLESQLRKQDVRAAVEAADLHRLFARGPFVTSHQKQIFVVDGYILTDEELIHLWRDGNLTPEGLRGFSDRQRRLEPSLHRNASPKPKAKSARAGRP